MNLSSSLIIQLTCVGDENAINNQMSTFKESKQHYRKLKFAVLTPHVKQKSSQKMLHPEVNFARASAANTIHHRSAKLPHAKRAISD